MICPKRGMETSPLDNGPCVVCEPVTAHSSLEKIEPMKIALGSFIGDTFGQDTRLAEKLNQVIENQNKIIDYLNQQVKK